MQTKTVTELTTKADLTQELENAGEKLVIIMYYAEHQKNSSELIVKLEELSKVYHSKAVFIQIDTDSLDEVSEEDNLHTLPTFELRKKLEKLERYTGKDAEGLKSLIDKHVE